MKSGSPLTHPDLGSNIAYTHSVAGGGDIDEAFRRADRIIKQRIVPPAADADADRAARPSWRRITPAKAR